jgi:site-specific DNA-methyltransferase (adenine-specific)
MITTSDSLQFLTTKQEHEFNILYADPPYALGSTVIVRPDGKVDYHKASDFMSKWEMPTGDYWEKWFKEAHRVLKNGGWLIMFGIDRQLLLFKYYALLAGFEEQQSLYWYFISNFPKATDLSKMLDKNAGVDREAIAPSQNARPKSLKEDNLYEAGTVGKEFDITAPSTDLAKKYDGYKYSISPLKQTNETIMIFKKPSKTGSVLHDTLAYESGDTTINVSALDIDGNRVELGENEKIPRLNVPYEMKANNNFGGGDDGRLGEITLTGPNGRYPAQTFIDNQVAEILDEQSGVSKSGNNGLRTSDGFNANAYGNGIGIKVGQNNGEYGDIGGASKILHKCNYEQDDVTLYHYEPKVSGSERNAGLGGFVDKKLNDLEKDKNAIVMNSNVVAKNFHPTLKPIDLNYRILKLFKLPTDQKICYPFAGSGSEIIGGIKAGFENWVGCEINAEYVAIANARINYWKETMWEQQSLFDEVI